jgi:aldehyde:ferredoxin oxidoreductase
MVHHRLVHTTRTPWIISYEVKTDRLGYTREKVERLVFLQDVRGGMFESLTTCRLPWVEVGLDLDYYPKLLTAAYRCILESR